MSDKELMNIMVPDNCKVCGSSLKLTFGVSLTSHFEQIAEKGIKDAIDSHNQKQTILKLERENARQKKIIGELYSQVHGKEIESLDKLNALIGIHLLGGKEKSSYFGGRVEDIKFCEYIGAYTDGFPHRCTLPLNHDGKHIINARADKENYEKPIPYKLTKKVRKLKTSSTYGKKKRK